MENQVYKNARLTARSLDEQLKKTTYAMIAGPAYFLNEVRGVIPCVQLQDVEVRDGKAVLYGRKRPPGLSTEPNVHPNHRRGGQET